MMRIRPVAGTAAVPAGCRVSTPASDMECLPAKREFEMECGALADGALDANLTRVFLQNAVGDGEAETGAAISAVARGVLGGKKRIVDAGDVFLRNAGAGVRDGDMHGLAVGGGDAQSAAAACHGVLCIQEQVEENLV